MAHNQPSERSGRSARAGAPGGASIRSHRLFPAVVAIWFAALFGLGCAVLPAALYERAVAATGLAALLPAAAPPLGLTARILLSLGATLLGAALGSAIARRLAGPQAGRDAIRSERFSRITGLQPIAAAQELGSAGFDALGDAEPEEIGPEEDQDRPEEWEEIERFAEPAAEWELDEPPVAESFENAGFDPPAAPSLPSSGPSSEPSLDELGLAALTERLARSLRDARDLPPVPPALLAQLKAAQAGSGLPEVEPEAEWPPFLPPETPAPPPVGLGTSLGSFRDYARDYTGGDDGEEEEAEEEEEDLSAGAGYGSLLGMKLRKKDPNAISPLDGLPPEALGLEMPGFEQAAPRRPLPSALE